MSKKAFKSQASSSRAFFENGLATNSGFALGASTAHAFGDTTGSTLSFVYEPPDLSGISDPTVGVSLKNLQKKDSTTKFKALENLHSHVALAVDGKESLDIEVVEVWTALFPRTSIDNSNRVRQSAYALQGKIASLSGKSFLKYMPSTIGAWLAGSYDRDRQVSRAARDSISSTFNTEEKRKGVWKAFQESILNYCSNAVQRETAQTLSDARITSPDDAEAKYSRAISGALLTLSGLLDTLATDDLLKHAEAYENCLQTDALWKLTCSGDSAIRKAVFRLAISAVEQLPTTINVPKLGTTLVRQCSSDQTGSATEFVRTLTYFTKLDSDIWRADKSEHTPIARLTEFLGKGSSGIGSEFYRELSGLLQTIPIEKLIASPSHDKDQSLMLIEALRKGITYDVSGRRDSEVEIIEKWQPFISLSERLVSHDENTERTQRIGTHYLLPIIEYYVDPDLVQEARNWPRTELLVQKIFAVAWSMLPELTVAKLQSISSSLICKMQASLPEQSKDFKRSQDNVIAAFTRWYSLQQKILASYPSLKTCLANTASAEMEAATILLKSRNSKPYCAAVVLELWTAKLAKSNLDGGQASKTIKTFCDEVIPRSLLSGSAASYLRLLRSLGSEQEISVTLDNALDQLLAGPRSQARSNALRLITLSYWPLSSERSHKLAQTILEDVQDAMTTDDFSSWVLPLAALENRNAPKNLDDDILNTMLTGLSIDEQTESTIQGFRQLASQNNAALQRFINSSAGAELLSRLLFLSHEGSPTLQSQSSNLRDAISAMAGDNDTNPISSIIRNNVLKTGSTALPIATLWLQAETHLNSVLEEQRLAAIKDLMPDVEDWKSSLQPYLEQQVDPVISIMDSLGGAVYLVPPPSETSTPERIDYDSQGYSAPFRAAIFSSHLLERSYPERLGNALEAEVYSLISLVDVLANDSQALICQRPLLDMFAGFDESESLAAIEEIRHVANNFVSQLSQAEDTSLAEFLQHLHGAASGKTSSAYHYARAYIMVTQPLIDTQRLPSGLVSDQSFISRIRRSPELFTDLISLTTMQNRTAVLKLFNDLISDLTALQDLREPNTLSECIALNVLLRNKGVELDAIPKQRLVYFVKACVRFLEKDMAEELRAEILKGLAAITPALADIYDEFWEDLIQQAVAAFKYRGKFRLVVVHAALQICTVMRKMLKDDPNEDLQEAWAGSETEVSQSLLMFLQHQARSSAQENQPLRIIYDLLYRLLSTSSKIPPMPVEDLFPVLESNSTMLHRTVYPILETAISAAQVNVSLDAALSSDYVPKLPKELLSFLSHIPDEMDTEDLKARPELPPSLSQYLLAWKLVLQHWDKASYKVRADYVANLKESSCVDDFLALCFTSLIEEHGGNNKAGYDPSRLASVTTYELNNSENPETEYLWLLCNIYYNLLLHVPHLAKAWHTNSCPRALKAHVETWTARYISPLIIAEELRTVSEWQPPSDDAKSELTVKIFQKASEATASLPLDDTFMSIKIQLPPSYPLAPINLSTVQRVGIDEKKWLAYLNVSRIMMNFSSTSQGLGSVIDGISAWRNNVLGALKGQNECAICYSVVAEDGKVPTKKCAVCSNLFHGLCLYKWFQRSASSSCPLCRNAFNYA